MSSALLFQADKCPSFSKHAKKILLAPKPAPSLDSVIRGELEIDNQFEFLFEFSFFSVFKKNQFRSQRSLHCE